MSIVMKLENNVYCKHSISIFYPRPVTIVTSAAATMHMQKPRVLYQLRNQWDRKSSTTREKASDKPIDCVRFVMATCPPTAHSRVALCSGGNTSGSPPADVRVASCR